MTQEELNKQLKELEQKHELEIKMAIRNYALANNQYNLGDIIEDHRCKIKIERILVSIYNKECVYEGTLLKKDCTPYQNGKKGKIYQRDIKTQ